MFAAALDMPWPCSSESLVEAAKLPKEVANGDNDIISYIGGAVLKKLIDKFGTNRNSRKVLEAFRAPEGHPNRQTQVLTAMKDRGGLLYLTSSAFNIFHKMESIFLAGDYGTSDIKEDTFLDECRGQLEQEIRETESSTSKRACCLCS